MHGHSIISCHILTPIIDKYCCKKRMYGTCRTVCTTSPSPLNETGGMGYWVWHYISVVLLEVLLVAAVTACANNTTRPSATEQCPC